MKVISSDTDIFVLFTTFVYLQQNFEVPVFLDTAMVVGQLWILQQLQLNGLKSFPCYQQYMRSLSVCVPVESLKSERRQP